MQIDPLEGQRLVQALQKGLLVVLKTDTIYGILARADDAAATHRLYSAKHRNEHKGCIMLVTEEMTIPGLSADDRAHYPELNRERPTTLVVPVPPSYMPHLVKPDDTLAFRVVNQEPLRSLIRQTGPLLAPSANPEGLPPATTIQQAVDYFGDTVSLYVDSGTVEHIQPSRIMALQSDQLVTLRK